MANVRVTPAADEDLEDLIAGHSLPDDTKARVKERIRQLERFPQSGALIGGGPWSGFRRLLRPWNWMLIVYEFDSAADTVDVVTIQDSRSSSAATSYPGGGPGSR